MESKQNASPDFCMEAPQPSSAGRRMGVLALFIVSSAVAAIIGSFILHNNGAAMDYKMIYAGVRCFLAHRDPYQGSVMESAWVKIDGPLPIDPLTGHARHLCQFIYPPTIATLVPFAELPWNLSHLAWIATTILLLSLGGYCIWIESAAHASDLSFLLIVVSLGTGPVFFVSANPAGVAIGLCLIAAWCFIREQFTWVGVFCMAASLAIKPHDGFLVWTCFLLVGGVLRRRALQAFALTLVLCLPVIGWVWRSAPGWPVELRANLAAITAPGELDDPRPQASSDRTAGMMINLQAGISLLDDDERIYNAVTVAICGSMLLFWAREILLDRHAAGHIWYALAAAAPMTMLLIYHRSYDAKLLLIGLPACARLWNGRGARGWTALLLGVFSIGLMNEVSLSMLASMTSALPVHQSGLNRNTLLAVLAHPAPFTLLAMSLFYLWVYREIRRAEADTSITVIEPLSSATAG